MASNLHGAQIMDSGNADALSKTYKIAHLSDLHFGKTDPRLVQALAERLHEVSPDLMVVSGDLTQRARHREFRAARAFFDSLPFPKIIVPGNHDIPLYALHLRFFRPYSRYLKWFGETGLGPEHMDERVCAIGASSVRNYRVSEGRLGSEKLAEIRERFEARGRERVRILVAHHPAFGDAGGADIACTGHLHRVSYERVKGTLWSQAGSTVSTRLRGEVNSFNLIEVGETDASVRVYSWDHERSGFMAAEPVCFPGIRGARSFESRAN